MTMSHRRSAIRLAVPRTPMSAVLAATLTLGLPVPDGAISLQRGVLAATAPARDGAAADLARRDRLAFAAQAALGLRAADVTPIDVPTLENLEAPIEVTIDGRLARLDVQIHSVRAPGYVLRVQRADGSFEDLPPGPVRTFRGHVQGEPDSAVAGAILDDGLHAVVRTADGTRRWIQPLASVVPGAAAEDHVVYLDGDVLPHGGECGATDKWLAGQPPFEVPPVVGGGVAGANLFCAELACDADFEYYQDWGSVEAVESRIHSVINTMNLQYEADVEIGHGITAIIVRTAEPDPYTTGDPSGLLNQFREEWLANHEDIERDVAHLFTGRNLNGSVIGIAWLSAVCSNSGFGVVQSDFSGNFACVTDLSAHELGHNWGADHCNCSSFTMNPSITCANQFSPSATIPDIVAFRNTRGCLDMCDAPEFGSAPLPFFDDFPSSTLDSGLWTGIDGAEATTTGTGEPSPTLSLNINGSDEVRTARLDASAAVRVELSYWWQRTGGGNSPESGEDLVVEYQDDQFNWIQVNAHPGAGPDTDPYQFAFLELPAGAKHEHLRIRFRGLSPNAGSDDWFVDDVTVNGIFAPANDDCETSSFVVEGDTPFTNVGASTDGPDESDDGCGAIGADVWFKFVSECTGLVTVSICDADFDTQLAVYGACPSFADDLVACNDDACGAQSSVTFVAEPALYRIRVGGFQDVEGNGTLSISCEPAASCPADCGQGDGIVDIVDLLDLLAQWGGSPGACDIAPLGTGDGVVDILDLLELLGEWGTCP